MNDFKLSGPTIHSVEWASAYFTAASINEPLQDVNIVTAKSKYVDLAYLTAAESAFQIGNLHTLSNINEAAQQVCDSEQIYVQESVDVSNDGIFVCINVHTVDNEEATWRALDMLAMALEYLNGQPGTVYFGEPLRFTSQEVGWIITH